MFSVLVIRLRSLRLLRVSGIVMRLRMFLLLITFLKASHSFRNRLLVICKNAYLFATMIMTRSEERRVGKECRYRLLCPHEVKIKQHDLQLGIDLYLFDREGFIPDRVEIVLNRLCSSTLVIGF